MNPNLIREEDFRIVDIEINLILSLYSGKYIKFNQGVTENAESRTAN